MSLCVAIIGSGPAGYYTAEALVNALGDDVCIDIIDRLPTPYGLIRAGVAPDHQSIKGVYRRYEKTNLLNNVRFVGNIDVGDAITIEELRDLYDAVVLAVGAPKDRPLGIKGDSLDGVIGSAAFVGWYNAHPDFEKLHPNLNIDTAAVIGNGNVAIDVARVLAKTPGEMENSDLARHAAEIIHSSTLKHIYMFGRRGPLEAKFTPKELGELGELSNCVTVVNPDHLPKEVGDIDPATRKNLTHLEAFAKNIPGSKPLTLHIEFYARPTEVLGTDKVTGLRLEHTHVENGHCAGTGDYFDIECGLVVPCIGYRTIPIPGVPYDNDRGRFQNEDGVIEDGLYCTGWARRGPSGTIGTNRPDAFEIAEQIASNIKDGGKAGRAGLDTLVKERDLWAVTFRDWKRIEEAEAHAAKGTAPRAKFASREELLAALK
ncbi:MAG: FAD-dependent oxidoreductase [Sphingomonadales bacterium]|jgi:ferredoxin--NADP+ reductase